jgi:hypothetical protein
MTPTIGQKQRWFARKVPRLIDKAHELGFAVTLGDAFRDPRVHGALGVKMGYGHPKSAHKLKIAIDLNLFRDVDGDGDLDFLERTEAHRQLGEWWESQAEPGYTTTWGGRFSTPDGNHYSVEHDGVR